MNNRRKLIVALGVCITPLGSLAQSTARMARVGILSAVSPSGWTPMVEALRNGLRELGYVEGKTITLEYRWAEGKYERLPELAAELVRSNVDVIVTHARAGVAA